MPEHKGIAIKCHQPDCSRSFQRKSKWDNIRAVDQGWFLQKSGENWGPEHTPEWVEEWREDKLGVQVRNEFLATIDSMLLSSDQIKFELMNSRDEWFLIYRSDENATPVAYKFFVELKKE